jgi:hypothetical protein
MIPELEGQATGRPSFERQPITSSSRIVIPLLRMDRMTIGYSTCVNQDLNVGVR